MEVMVMEEKKLILNGQEYEAGILCDSGAILLKNGDKYYLMIDDKKVKEIEANRYISCMYDGPASQYDIDNYMDYEFYKKND